MAVSIDILNFYHALFERSCDAVNAMAGAMNTFYTRRGFVLLDKHVSDFISLGLNSLITGFAGQTHKGCISTWSWVRDTVV